MGKIKFIKDTKSLIDYKPSKKPEMPKQLGSTYYASQYPSLYSNSNSVTLYDYYTTELKSNYIDLNF